MQDPDVPITIFGGLLIDLDDVLDEIDEPAEPHRELLLGGPYREGRSRLGRWGRLVRWGRRGREAATGEIMGEENTYLREEVTSALGAGDIIGNSPGLRKVMQQTF